MVAIGLACLVEQHRKHTPVPSWLIGSPAAPDRGNRVICVHYGAVGAYTRGGGRRLRALERQRGGEAITTFDFAGYESFKWVGSPLLCAHVLVAGWPVAGWTC